jgi:RNA-directed DNA polymerase
VGLGDKSLQMSRQLELPFRKRGEAPDTWRSEEESAATRESDAPGASGLMERVVERANLIAAWRRVRKNKGSPGVDGMTVDELTAFLRENWPRIREELLAGKYRPQPVLQKLIPKGGGGTRMLGIPTVLDRFVQQALLQVLQPIYDPTFSDHSHGFRPGRSAHDALREARAYVEGGRRWVVDVDLSKFFDRVNHDVLMGRVARRTEDRRVLGLIRRYLRAGIMADGVVVERQRGTPQGGPLSPLLANILLDEVDKELERRGHAFSRYADDSRVYVGSRRAGERVMELLRRLYGQLRLVINEEKSAVAPFGERPFLGYGMYQGKTHVGFYPAPKSVARLKNTVRAITRRTIGRSMEDVVRWLEPRLRGWKNYFQLAKGADIFRRLDGWIRRRLRALQLAQWRNCDTIHRSLRALGASEKATMRVVALTGRWWRAAGTASHASLPNRYFDRLGVFRLVA